jgi:hypothetical protein
MTLTPGVLPRLARLVPARSEAAGRLIAFLVRAAHRLDGPAAARWRERIADLYGDLAGQRAVARDPRTQRYLAAAGGAAVPDLILALQTYFALVCDALAVAHLTAASPRPLHTRACAIRQILSELASGNLLAGLGISPAGNPLPLDWFLGQVSSRELGTFRDVFAAVADLADSLGPADADGDLLHWLYARVMPRNLLHILGEFHTPFWLAQLLLRDAGWDPSRRLLDPFAGTGVFLLAAIHQARGEGRLNPALLDRLAARELNPAAFTALRTNLLLALVDRQAPPAEPLRLPIACEDALLPALPPLPPADILVTNPPWVGWEYLPRAARERLGPVWKKYGLFTARGREAAFLKEDLSTLALVAAWDRYLKPGGISAVVLRPAAMQSHLAARGLRRLSVYPERDPLALRLIRTFAGIRPFAGIGAPAAAWCLEKGAPTRFPVPVLEWRAGGWRPGPFTPLADVRSHVVETRLAARRSDPADPGSPWVLGPAPCHRATEVLRGQNDYRVRSGVFTGGANAVYYLEPLPRPGWYRNLVDGAKRQVEPVTVPLEGELIYEVVRGRDLRRWRAVSEAHLLCPHTAATRMRALPLAVMAEQYPRALAYLERMRAVLEGRRGFAGWERYLQREAFYAIQRIGAYSFAPYKTAWRYVAADFVVAVVGPGRDGKPRLCNDKVMYVSFPEETPAYFLCGLLSSDPVRWRVTATMTGTQISTSVIKHLRLPPYAEADAVPRTIADCCRRGHEHVAAGRPAATCSCCMACRGGSWARSNESCFGCEKRRNNRTGGRTRACLLRRQGRKPPRAGRCRSAFGVRQGSPLWHFRFPRGRGVGEKRMPKRRCAPHSKGVHRQCLSSLPA